MHLSRKLRITGVLVALAFPRVHVRASDLSTYADVIRMSQLAQARGQYADAERLIREAMTRLSEPKLHDGVALQNRLGHVHEMQGRLADAESDYRKALALNAQSTEPDEEQRAVSLNNLGTIALSRGSVSQAQAEIQESSATLEKAGLSQSPTAGLVLANLCVLAREQEKLKEARQWCAEAEPLILRNQGANSLEYARFLVSAGFLSFQAGDFRGAVENGRRGLDIEKHLEFVRPLDKALAEHNLALVLLRVGQVAEAQELLTDTVAIYRTEPTQQDRGLPDALNSLASAQIKREDIAAAKENIEAGLRFAKPGSDVAGRLHNTLGRVELHRENWQAARKQFEEALLIWRNLNRDQTAEYAAGLVNMGTLYDRTGKHKQAESHYRAAVAIETASLGPEHPQVAEDLENVATQVYARKQFAEALSLYERARDIKVKVYGPASSQVAWTWRNIGVVSQTEKRLDDSQQAYAKAVAAYSASKSEDRKDFGLCLREYAALLRRLERFREAELADLQATRIQVTDAILAEKSGHGASPALSLR